MLVQLNYTFTGTLGGDAICKLHPLIDPNVPDSFLIGKSGVRNRVGKSAILTPVGARSNHSDIDKVAAIIHMDDINP